MPCSDPDYDQKSAIPESKIFQKNKELQKKVNQLTSMLCALMSELKYPNDYRRHKTQCINNATKACGISLESWFAEHQLQDVNRMKKLIVDLNDHELELLKQQLDKK
jgi:mRNA-degrading endonuclease YafQ of YafQ-DinJ toxin-antitoxin module